MILLVVAGFFAVLNWWAAWFEKKRLIYVTKPASLFFLILWSYYLSGWDGRLIWFGLALIFSLLGDIFLMLSDRFFLFGLTAFLTGHVFYIVGFNNPPAALSLWMLAPLVAVSLGYVWIMSTVLRGLHPSLGMRNMRIPVLIYGLVISIMVFSALNTQINPEWTRQAALLASLGSILFMFSDSILAYARFVRSIPHEGFWVMIAYHLGQFGIIAAALVQAGVL